MTKSDGSKEHRAVDRSNYATFVQSIDNTTHAEEEEQQPLLSLSDTSLPMELMESGDPPSDTPTASNAELVPIVLDAGPVHLKSSKAHNFYISIPWSPQIYFSVRGAENFHIYLWIAKDLSWSQDELVPALLFGIAALLWCVVLVYHAVKERCYNEMYMLVPMILWLTGNFVWMIGEVANDDDDVVGPKSSYIFETAIGLILIYYFVLKPLKVLPPDALLDTKYDEADLHPRFPFFFANWREYEHAHTLCWVGKDLSWDRRWQVPWIIFLVPTVLIAADFIWTTAKSKKMTIDCAHYIAQLLWVLANFMWALGEVFDIPGNDDDKVYLLWSTSPQSREKMRWWSGLLLLLAYVPIALLYCIWLPLTCMGRIKAADIPENDHLTTAAAAQKRLSDVDKPGIVVSAQQHKASVTVIDAVASPIIDSGTISDSDADGCSRDQVYFPPA